MAERVVSTSSDAGVTAEASMTASDSGTTVHQWSCHAEVSGAETTRPRSASSVVTPMT